MIEYTWWGEILGEDVQKLSNKELAEKMALHVSSRRSAGLGCPNGAWDMMLEAAKRLHRE